MNRCTMFNSRLVRANVPTAAKQHRKCARVCAATATSVKSARGGFAQPPIRVLRYPDGHERRIIYPVEQQPELDYEVEDWTPWTEEDDIPWNECNLAGAACHVTDADPLVDELLQRRAPVRNIMELVKESYQVLGGSPWLQPRPLYVLAQEQLIGQGTLHCVPTRCKEDGVQDELAALLKRPDLAESLIYSTRKDGVVAFEREEDAARYATCLEADMVNEVEVMEVDSHQLFRLTGDVKAVVIYVPWTEFVPMPQQLAAALMSD